MHEENGRLYPDNADDAFKLAMSPDHLIYAQWLAIKEHIPGLKFKQGFTENGGSVSKSGKSVRPKNKKGHDQAPKP